VALGCVSTHPLFGHAPGPLASSATTRPTRIVANESSEFIMAVQQNKKSPSKRGMHRSHNALGTPGMAIEPQTGEVHLRHHISPNGFYKGKRVITPKTETVAE
jgi:large subunit ribosomal protein L32